jgi:hypothetical protein
MPGVPVRPIPLLVQAAGRHGARRLPVADPHPILNTKKGAALPLRPAWRQGTEWEDGQGVAAGERERRQIVGAEGQASRSVAVPSMTLLRTTPP